MKIKFITCFFITQLLTVNTFSQSVSVSEKELVKNVYFPDGPKFMQDLIKSKACKKLYKMAKDSSDYITYRYEFELSKNKVINPIFEEDQIFQQLNLFMKEKFKHYSWKTGKNDAHFINKINYYGTLIITMLPMRKIIRLEIGISDGKISEKMNSKIVLKKDISEHLL